jgi:hypothetical protein
MQQCFYRLRYWRRALHGGNPGGVGGDGQPVDVLKTTCSGP